METSNATTARFDSIIAQPVKVMDRVVGLRNRSGSDVDESGTADKINVSQEALLITEALRGAQNAPDIRQEKIDAIRAQLEAGTYNIDNRQLAMNLIREEAQLFTL